jgi:hypothetical protein
MICKLDEWRNDYENNGRCRSGATYGRRYRRWCMDSLNSLFCLQDSSTPIPKHCLPEHGAHAPLRNALRSPGSRSSAAPTISLIFGQCSVSPRLSCPLLPPNSLDQLVGFLLNCCRALPHFHDQCFEPGIAVKCSQVWVGDQVQGVSGGQTVIDGFSQE